VPAGDLVVVALVIAFAGAVQLTTGFGFALAAVPLMALAIDPHDAVIITLGVATFTNGFQAWEGRAVCDRTVLARLLGGAVVGLPIGLAVFVAADPSVMRLIIGLAVIVAVMSLASGIDLRHANATLDVGSGLVSGALTTSVGTNGPPVVFALQARHFSPDRFRATITTHFLVLDVASIAVFAVAGELTADILVASLVAVPGLLFGALVGIRVREHLDPVRFRRVVMALLVAAAVTSLAAAAARWGDSDDDAHWSQVTGRTSSATARAMRA
jgi:uncharacterized membrane protein YfcA